MSSISFIGIGSAGIATANLLTDTNVYKLKTIAIDTDTQRLATAKADVKIQAGKITCNGNGTGFNPELGEKAMDEVTEVLKRELEGSNLVIISTGLGGGTGSGGIGPVMQAVKDLGILSYTLVTTPFGYESLDGSAREFNTQYALDSITKINTAHEVLDGAKIQNFVSDDFGLFEMYDIARLELVNKIKALVSLVVEQGEINIDFADITRVLNIGGRSFINTVSGDSIHNLTKVALEPKFNQIQAISGVAGTLANLVTKTGSKLDVLAINSKLRSISSSNVQNKVGLVRSEDDTKTLTIILTGIGSNYNQFIQVNYSKEFEALKEAQKSGINQLNRTEFVF